MMIGFSLEKQERGEAELLPLSLALPLGLEPRTL